MIEPSLLDLMLGAPVAPESPQKAPAPVSTPAPLPELLGAVQPESRASDALLDGHTPVYDVQDYDGRHVIFSWDRDPHRHTCRSDRITTA